MPIEFDKRKDKNLIMMVEKSGVDDDNLKLTFNIEVNEIKYGFPCKIKENKVIINIPPLDSIINDLDKGLYKATLDITGNDKYFMQPFNEDIEIIDVPNVIVDKDSLKESELFIKVSELIEDGKITEDKPEISEDKPSEDEIIEENDESPEEKPLEKKKVKFNIDELEITEDEDESLKDKDKPSEDKLIEDKEKSIVLKMFE